MKRGIKRIGNKKAQFYLLAAAVIVVIVVVIGVLMNYSPTESKPGKVYDLSKELGLEISRVVDYGIFKRENTDVLIYDFSVKYMEYSQTKANINWYLYYGDADSDELKVIEYSQGEVGGMSVGNVRFPVLKGSLKSRKPETKETIKGAEGTILILLVNGIEYSIKVTPGKQFYFVLEEYTEGEKYIVSE